MNAGYAGSPQGEGLRLRRRDNPSGASRHLPLHRGGETPLRGYTSSDVNAGYAGSPQGEGLRLRRTTTPPSFAFGERHLPLHRGGETPLRGYTSSGASRRLSRLRARSGRGSDSPPGCHSLPRPPLRCPQREGFGRRRRVAATTLIYITFIYFTTRRQTWNRKR